MPLSSKISDAITGGRSQAFLSDEIDDVVFDSVINYTENDSSTVSRHTVEDGADVSDHVDAQPKTIEFSAILTDNDQDLLDPASFFDETMQDRFGTLEFWKDTSPLLTYYGHETDIEDVVLTNVTRNKTLDTGEGWGVDISLQVVNIATFQVEDISLSSVTGKGATSKGSNKRAGSATSKKRKSILKRIIG